MDKKKLDKAAEAARAKLDLTVVDLGRLQNIAHGVYDEVSQDLPPDFKKKHTCRRSTIIEVVCDAGRIETAVRRQTDLQGLPDFIVDNHPMIRACRSGLIVDLIGPAFQYSEYEVEGSLDNY